MRPIVPCEPSDPLSDPLSDPSPVLTPASRWRSNVGWIVTTRLGVPSQPSTSTTWVVRPLAAKDAHHSVLASARNWDANRISEDASLINQPTLIIWGEKDLVIPIKNGYKLNQLILNSKMVVFPNCGHLPHEELTDSVVSVINGFCQEQKSKK